MCFYRVGGVLLQDERCAFTGWKKQEVCFYGMLKNKGFSERCAFTGLLKNKGFSENALFCGMVKGVLLQEQGSAMVYVFLLISHIFISPFALERVHKLNFRRVL